MEKLYTVKNKNKNKTNKKKKKKQGGVDCGSDHECLIAKCRVKWKKVGKTTRPFRYDLKNTL